MKAHRSLEPLAASVATVRPLLFTTRTAKPMPFPVDAALDGMLEALAAVLHDGGSFPACRAVAIRRGVPLCRGGRS
jgi:hypothetical protein